MSTLFTALVAPLFMPLFQAGLPPIQSANDAVLVVNAARDAAAVLEATKSVRSACQGKLRLSLREHAPLISAFDRLLRAELSLEAKKSVLDTLRCFSPAKVQGMVAKTFTANDPGLVAHGAEVAARMESPELIAPLLSALDARQKSCLEDASLAAEVIDACVWLTYGPGALLGNATIEQRVEAKRRAEIMLDSVHPKVREVAVETLFSARLKPGAEAIRRLIAKEKAKGFAIPNTPALLNRFAERAAALTKSGQVEPAIP